MKKIRKISILFLLTFLLVLPQIVIAGQLKPDLSEIINKTPATEKVSVIILFHERQTPADISIIKSDGASIKYQYNIINAVSAKVPAQAADKIAKRAFVKLVEPDYKVKLVLDKSVTQIQADKVWESNITGKNIDIAIIDTGIHDEHPSLVVEKEVDYTGEGTDDLHGHGTHVAGIVSSTDPTYRGVSNADLFNVKVLNKDGFGYGSDLIKGIEWAVDNGVEVISMSLGAEIDPCDGTDAISQAVDKAVSKGVVVVVAAGNSGPDSGTITSPGCSKKGITVGAADDNDNVPSFSSRGPTDDGRVKPDVVAPGVSITSTWKDNSFTALSGTSMSTPHVSGVAALLLEADSTLKPSDIKEIIKTTALDLGLDENIQGTGRLDAYAAYLSVTNITEEPENETEENKTKELPPGLEKKLKLPPAFERGLPRAGMTPDSFIYGFKKFFERADLLLTFDEVARAKKHVKYAELRLAEAREMDKKGKPEFIGDLLEEYEDNLEKGNEISKIAQQAGKNVTEVTELVAVATSIHLGVLEDIYDRVPEQVKPSIRRAITSSKKGNEEALNILGGNQPKKSVESLKTKDSLGEITEEIQISEEVKEKIQSIAKDTQQEENQEVVEKETEEKPSVSTTSSNSGKGDNSGTSGSGSSGGGSKTSASGKASAKPSKY